MQFRHGGHKKQNTFVLKDIKAMRSYIGHRSGGRGTVILNLGTGTLNSEMGDHGKLYWRFYHDWAGIN